MINYYLPGITIFNKMFEHLVVDWLGVKSQIVVVDGNDDITDATWDGG